MHNRKTCLILAVILSGILMLPFASCSAGSACLLAVTVTNKQGSPVVGANVSSVSQPEGQAPLTGVTGPEGTITFKGVKPGDYRIGVEYSDYIPRAMEFTLKGGQNFLAQFVISAGLPEAPVIPTYPTYGEENA